MMVTVVAVHPPHLEYSHVTVYVPVPAVPVLIFKKLNLSFIPKFAESHAAGHAGKKHALLAVALLASVVSSVNPAGQLSSTLKFCK